MEAIETISGCQELGEGRMKRQSTDVLVSETMLYDPIMVGACYHTFVEVHGMYDTKSEP